MAVDIAGAMERGFDRVTTRQGGTLVGVFVLAALVVDLTWETVLARFVAGDPFFEFVPPAVAAELREQWAGYEVLVGLDVPVVSLVALVVFGWLVQFVLRIGAKRWFVGDADRDLAASLFTRRVGWTLLNLVVGGVLYLLAVTVGLVLLVVPGIFLAVALYFYTYEVIVEGENGVDALVKSYELTAGDRFELFLLGLLFFVLGGVVGVLAVPGVLPGRVFPAAIGAAATAAFGVYSIATAADVYRQLVESAAEEEAAEPDGGPGVEGSPTG